MRRLTMKDILSGMPPKARANLAEELGKIDTPESKAAHADVLRAMEQLQNDVTKRAKKKTMESQLFS